MRFKISKFGDKGQAELVGLAIVVLLLIFALIFFVQIKSNQDDNETELIVTNLRANSALNALMKVHIEDEQLKDWIEKCDSDVNSCQTLYDFLDKNLKEIFEKKSRFYFAIKEGNKVFQPTNFNKFEFGDCVGGISASPFVIRNVAIVNLNLCY